MAQRVLLGLVHLAECLCSPCRDEHRVVTEALRASRRPGHLPVHPSDEGLGMAIGPGNAQRGDEPCTLVRSIGRFAVHPLHRGVEILRRPGPARRMYARRAVQRSDAEAGIVRQRRQPARAGRCQRLDPSVADEVWRVLLGFGQANRCGGDDRDAMRPQQVGKLLELARIVARQDKPRATVEPARHHAASTAWRCASNSDATPWRARPSMPRNCVSLNAVRSAVPWISTMPPASVSTKLASASADESSA
jgi:hypothetical protein